MSKHQHHGDVHQTIDTHTVGAFGSGSVASGGGITGSTVTTGGHNQVGVGNVAGHGNVAGFGNQVLDGSHDTAAFGSGAAGNADLHDLNVGHGGAIAVGGNASGTRISNDSHNHTSTTTVTENTYDHSFNTDVHQAYGSFNDIDTHTVTDSHNTTIQHFLSDDFLWLHV